MSGEAGDVWLHHVFSDLLDHKSKLLFAARGSASSKFQGSVVGSSATEVEAQPASSRSPAEMPSGICGRSRIRSGRILYWMPDSIMASPPASLDKRLFDSSTHLCSFPSDGGQHVQAKPNRLILRIHRASIAVGRIRNCADIRYQRLNVGPAESVAPGWHERRLIERRAAMADDSSDLGIGQFVEDVAFGERVRLDFEIIEVGYTLYSRFGIVAALAILIVELAAQGLLVTQSDLFDGQSNFLSDLCRCSMRLTDSGPPCRRE